MLCIKTGMVINIFKPYKQFIQRFSIPNFIVVLSYIYDVSNVTFQGHVFLNENGFPFVSLVAAAASVAAIIYYHIILYDII